MDGFCPTRLRLARHRRALTLAQLGALVQVTPGAISNMESGKLDPSPESVSRLAMVLRFPREFFFDGEVDLLEPAEGGRRGRDALAPVASFRSLRSLTSRDRERAMAAGTLGVLVVEELQRRRLRLPAVDLPDLAGQDPESAALTLRELWGLGLGPIDNVVHLLEAHGVRVFRLVEECRALDAYAFWLRHQPYVCLDADKNGERGRYNAAHELGHLVLHRDRDACGRLAEAEANAFAGAFLLPKRQFIAECPRLPDLEDLVFLKERWRVSLAALAYRAHDLRIMSDWAYRQAFITLHKHGDLDARHSPIAHEHSQLFPRAFEILSPHMTPESLASTLHLPFDELRDLLPLPATWWTTRARPTREVSHLRLVPSAEAS